MTTTDKRKRSLYFPDTILKEMQIEAKRQERSLSWIVQYAWRIARTELMRLPSVGNAAAFAEDDDEREHEEVDHDHGAHHRNQGFGEDGFPHHGG